MCAAAASAAAATQGGAPGCVLPQIDAPVPVAQVPETVPLGTTIVAPAAVAGTGFLPILLGLAVFAGVIGFFVANNGSKNNRIRLPNSPA
jgi:hypothetical protein